MKIFRFEIDDNCGSCNWHVTMGYLLADSKEEAEKLLKDIQAEGGNALCGDCFAEMLAEGDYIVIQKAKCATGFVPNFE